MDVNAATREEMMQFCTDTIGIRVAHNIGDEALRQKIADYLAPESAKGPKKKSGLRRYEVVILEEKGGVDPVPIGVGGVIHAVQRGKKVILDESYVDVLKNAVQDVYEPETMKKSHLKAYPFQILREVTS